MLFYTTAVLKEMEISRAQNFLLYLVQSTEFPFSFSLEDRIFGLEDRISISYQSGGQYFRSGGQDFHLLPVWSTEFPSPLSLEHRIFYFIFLSFFQKLLHIL